MFRWLHHAALASRRRLLTVPLYLGIVCGLGDLPAHAQPEPGDPVGPVDHVGPFDQNGAPPLPCFEDAAVPRHEVEAAFAELQRIHRGRVAGPAGQKLLETRVSVFLERLVGFDLFIDLVLGDAWDQALPDQRLSWRTALADTLRRRYLRKLGSPLAASVDIQSVVLRCDRAEVALHIIDRKGKHPQDVMLQLVATRVVPTPPEPAPGPIPVPPVVAPAVAPFEATPPEIVWRAFDVAVDGVSLLETWKSRFRRIYEDGGVAAIDHHMRGLRDRYGTRSE